MSQNVAKVLVQSEDDAKPPTMGDVTCCIERATQCSPHGRIARERHAPYDFRYIWRILLADGFDGDSCTSL